MYLHFAYLRLKSLMLFCCDSFIQSADYGRRQQLLYTLYAVSFGEPTQEIVLRITYS